MGRAGEAAHRLPRHDVTLVGGEVVAVVTGRWAAELAGEWWTSLGEGTRKQAR